MVVGFDEARSAKLALSARYRDYRTVPEAEIEAIGTREAGIENIVGVATSYKVVGGRKADQACVKVYVVKKLGSEYVQANYFVPETFEDVPTDVEEIGEIVAELDTGCHSPLEGGISVGHIGITAGTLGCFVRNRGGTETPFALSNNHVLADVNRAQQGDMIVQPGPMDGGAHTGALHPGDCGSPDTCIGTLVWWEPIDPTADNEIDAAIAEVNWRKWDPAIRLLGRISGGDRATIDARIAKVGRTTDLTKGSVEADDADIRVRYRDSSGRTLFTAEFVDQIAVLGESGRFSKGGDSGSVYLDEEKRVVGLHFAGAGGRSFGNHIEPVLDKLNVEPI